MTRPHFPGFTQYKTNKTNQPSFSKSQTYICIHDFVNNNMPLPTPLLLLLLLIIMTVVTQYAGAQTPLPPQSNVNNYNYNIDNYNDDDGAPYRDNFNAATAILVVVLVSAFFFLAFLSLYFRRCSRDRSAIASAVAAGAVTTSRRGARREGLNPAILETFPTLAYSDVTQLKVGKESLECAVCLSEFTNDETLRMLPRCCHVFHPECIDTWLQTHVTCPVCRDNLAVVPTEEEEAGYQVPRLGGEMETEESSSDQRAVIVDIARMGRSHSTGHVSGGGGADRFTLRLPEHVRREIVGDGMMLRRSASVAVVSAVGRRNMEGEDGGGSWRRRGLIRAGLSGRWTSGILGRVTSTWRKREEGSVSGSGSVKRVEMKSEGSLKAAGMFDCLGGGTRSDSRDDEPISRNVNESKDDTTSVLDRV